MVLSGECKIGRGCLPVPLRSNLRSSYLITKRTGTDLSTIKPNRTIEAATAAEWTASERLAFASVASILLVLIGMASWLVPDPAGVGTHQQLGLPGCTMLTVFGVRCPACGMTTSWAHTLDGDLVSGIRASLSGVLMCLASLFLMLAFTCFAISGRGYLGIRLSLFLLILLGSIVSISLVEWLIRLAAG